MDFPEDVDGNILKGMQERGFAFDRDALIDFNVDFNSWPPDGRVISDIETNIPNSLVSLRKDYMLVQVRARLTYKFVVDMQVLLSKISKPFGGWCESWGVLWNPNTNS